MSAPRTLGPGSASALVVASMIGAGVFTTSGFALADLGRREWVLLAWVVGGAIATCGALCYGALGRRIPESGGEYTFLSATVHPLAGFLAGWVSLVAGFTAPIAAAALGLAAYLEPLSASVLRSEWVGTAAILLAAALHGIRLEPGVLAQNLAVALKLLLLLGFISLGLWMEPASHAPTAVSFEIGAFGVTLVWISFAYSGWNAAVYVGGEVRAPERNLQRSLLLATAAVTLVYLGLNGVFLYAAPVEALAGRADVGSVAAEAIGGAELRNAVSLLVALALFTSISSMTMAGPRVYARMAEHGFLPSALAQRAGTPRAAVTLQATLAILVLWSTGLAELLGYIGFTLGISAAATVAGLIALRRREGPLRVPVPGYPLVPLAFISATLAASLFLIWREPLEAATGLATIAAGLPLYLWGRRRAGSSMRQAPGNSHTRATTTQ